MDVGSGLTRKPRCAASGLEGQAATGRGVLSDWQAERLLGRRGASGAEPDRSGRGIPGNRQQFLSGKVAARGSGWQRVAARGSGADGKGLLSQKQMLGLRPWQ